MNPSAQIFHELGVRVVSAVRDLRLMNFRYLWIGLVLIFAVLLGCGRSREAGPPKAVPVRLDGAVELRLMTFNVRYENQDDHDSRAWRQRIPRVVRMIRRQQPDLIGVQEALHGQAADLWASLPDYDFLGVGRDDGLRLGEYSGIFYRRDRFQLDPAEQGTFWLSDTPGDVGSRTWGNEIPRAATWGRLFDLATGRAFYLFNTHWDHRSQPSRERAALLIAERIDHRKHPDEPVALIGDFNSVETNPGYLYLTGKKITLAGREQVWPSGLVDTYQALHPQEKNRRTLHLWRGSRDGLLKVDHILVSRSARILESRIVSGDEPMVSDHFPVTARVIFPLK
jgi:endonuclease/exonuclease/phosphatase family metal-dependent hydrolase